MTAHDVYAEAKSCSIAGCTAPSRARGWCNRHYLRWLRGGNPFVPVNRFDPEARFFARVQVAPNGCWQWMGKGMRHGYGRMYIRGETVPAHKWAYEHWVGPVPEGLQLDHFKCDNRSCVNPTHVRPVTPRENTLRSNGLAARNAAKTHCNEGHPLSGANLHVFNGYRICRACRSAAGRRHRARKREAA